MSISLHFVYSPFFSCFNLLSDPFLTCTDLAAAVVVVGMALQNTCFMMKSVFPAVCPSFSSFSSNDFRVEIVPRKADIRGRWFQVALALDRNSSSSCNNDAKKRAVPNSNYVVPLDKFSSSSCINRPLNEILRDLNKKIPDNIIKPEDPASIPWYHANRMLSFYAPGWCGEIRDVIFSDNGSVTVVYRVTIRGSDGEAHRESTGTVSSSDGDIVDSVAAAEEIAFCRACARFGLGLYLYHEE